MRLIFARSEVGRNGSLAASRFPCSKPTLHQATPRHTKYHITKFYNSAGERPRAPRRLDAI